MAHIAPMTDSTEWQIRVTPDIETEILDTKMDTVTVSMGFFFGVAS